MTQSHLQLLCDDILKFDNQNATEPVCFSFCKQPGHEDKLNTNYYCSLQFKPHCTIYLYTYSLWLLFTSQPNSPSAVKVVALSQNILTLSLQNNA